jgi:transposase
MLETELPNDILELKGLILGKETLIGFLKRENEILREQISFFKALKFAPKSEKLSKEQLFLFNEAEISSQEPEIEEEKIPVKGYQRRPRGKRKPLPESFPREEVVIDLPDPEKFCGQDGSILKPIGEEISEKLEIIPAKIKVIRTIRKKYACPICDESLKTAPNPPSILPKSIATPSLLSFIVTSKFVDGIPLYRMENVLGRFGVDLTRATMSRWMVEVAGKLAPLKQILREELIDSPYIQCDETTIQVLKEKGRPPSSKSYMWVQCRTGKNPIILFDYFPGRSGDIPVKLLEGFKGYLQTDGYGGYNKICSMENVIRIGCMAHCRRRFFKAFKHSLDKNIGSWGLGFIRKLYKIEEKAKELTYSDRFEIRKKEAVPILADFKSWMEGVSGKVPPNGYAGQAISYALGEWENLIGYLKDGILEIDNNFIERSIRPFTIGRKNWIFSDTPAGAYASALWYTLVETAKLNDVEPFEYLKMVLEKLPYAQTLEDFLDLLPFKLD